jgi:hypothetical protein
MHELHERELHVRVRNLQERQVKRPPRAFVLSFALTSLFACSAHANSATGLKGLIDGIALLIGVAALALSAVLGAMSWTTALRPPTAVGWIFGRGFLAISAIAAFGVGGLFVAMGLEVWVKRTPDWLGILVCVLVAGFLSIEFFIAAVLYRRSNAHRASTAAKLLGFASVGIGAVFALVTVLLLGLFAFTAFVPEEQKGPTSEVRGYQKGCEKNVASDCNMLGLRYKTGDRGLPKDPEKSVRSFEKACDLGASIGCRNAASMYSAGEGIPKDEERARKLSDRVR